jgi:hypothetical protein
MRLRKGFSIYNTTGGVILRYGRGEFWYLVHGMLAFNSAEIGQEFLDHGNAAHSPNVI